MPVAFVNGDVDGLDASFISPDESAAGGESGVRHLASLGNVRICFPAGPRRHLPGITAVLIGRT